MLRRPPTILTLTSEDISIYEDKRRKEAEEREKSTKNNNNNINSGRPASAHRYLPEQLLASEQSAYSRPSPTHVKRRTILDPPLPTTSTYGSSAGWAGDAASEQDLRDFAAARDRAQLQQQRQQQQRHQQHRARGAGHAVHFTPVPRGTPITQQAALAAAPAPHRGGAGTGLGVSEIGDDSDFPTAALSSPPEAPALSSSEAEEEEEEDREGEQDDDDDDDESPEDEEMEDYDIPGQIQALPRSARPAVYAHQNHHHQPPQAHHHQQHHHHHQTPAAATNLTTPVNNNSAGSQIHQQQTPVPNNHSTAAVSQIPQAPLRRVHARTVSAARGAGTSSSSSGGIGRGGSGEAQAPQQPPLAPPRITRSRDERIGAPAAGSRRTGR